MYTGSCLGFEREGMEGVGQSLASPKGRSSIIAAAACLCNRDCLCVATSGGVYCYLCICVLFLCIAFVYCFCVFVYCICVTGDW